MSLVRLIVLGIVALEGEAHGYAGRRWVEGVRQRQGR